MGKKHFQSSKSLDGRRPVSAPESLPGHRILDALEEREGKKAEQSLNRY